MLTSRSKSCNFRGYNWRTSTASAQVEGFAPPVLYGCNSDGPSLAAQSPKFLHRHYCMAVTDGQETVKQSPKVLHRQYCTGVTDGPETAAHSPKVLHRQYCTAVTLTDH